MILEIKKDGCQRIGRSIGEIHRYSCMHFSKEFSKFGIGHGQFPFLLTLYRSEGVTQEDLSRRLKVDKATAARAIKKLEDEGYVTREKRLDDKRAYSLVITEKAKKIKADVYSIMDDWENKIKSCLSEEEVSQLLLLLSKLNENLYDK